MYRNISTIQSNSSLFLNNKSNNRLINILTDSYKSSYHGASLYQRGSSHILSYQRSYHGLSCSSVLKYPLSYNKPFSQSTKRSYSLFFGGGPYEVYSKRSNSIIPSMPLPMRIFGSVAGAVAMIFFIPIALIIAVAPPIMLGLWLFASRWRRLRNKLYNQRWSNMGSYHLTYEPDDNAGSLVQQAIPNIAKRRILNAIEHDEKSIASNIINSPVDELRFTELESIQQDFRASSHGFQEKMEIRTFGLVDIKTDRRLANILLIIHKDFGNKNDKSRMRIEIQGIGYRSDPIVLDEPSYDDSDDIVIDVKAKK